jgi:peptidoglycan/xylan/chitin deacetylase (PgdA/CDA1 family)
LYFSVTPHFFSALFPDIVWTVKSSPHIYLSFDDGPHPDSTPQILKLLNKHKIKATFFCLGKNLLLFPELKARILREGHALANHGHEHISGWRTSTEDYLEDISKTAALIPGRLFRPAYGRLSWKQYHQLKKTHKLIMWSHMPGDFDDKKGMEDMYHEASKTISPGSIIALHDHPKCLDKCLYYINLIAEKDIGFSSMHHLE